MKIYYSKGSIKELGKINRMFQDAIVEMDKNKIPQWDTIYPNQEDLKEDIEKEELYVGKVGEDIAVVFVLNTESDEQYATGDWQYPDASYKVLHRLCVNPKFQKCGIGADTLRYIEELLRNNGVETIRLDAFSLNPYALRMYDKAGYRKTGEVRFRKGKFYLMEKYLN